MSEQAAIERTPFPRTRAGLAADLRALGLPAGATVLVHASLSSLGWVNGGEETVVLALLDTLGSSGTLVMPAHSGDRGDPAGWQNPPVPADWVQVIRDTMPAYDPATTPTRGMGRIAELFRRWPGSHRSVHPHVSFAALGPAAEAIVGDHPLADSLGEQSPLARLYDLDAWVLLLGARYDSNTSFHLAEYRLPNPPRTVSSAPVRLDGERVWVTYPDIEFNEDLFGRLGEAFERIHPVQHGPVGSAQARLFRQRPAVDFAVGWLQGR